MSDYSYDVFISYRRNGNVADWVQRHLVKVLSNCLTDELEREPTIFLDVRMDTGTLWPTELMNGLQRSRVMVAVLSPQYFRSSWCLAEWETLARREAATGHIGRLIFPLTFSDGDRFPPSALDRQCRSMKPWAYPYPQFSESLDFLPFHDEVRSIAVEIARRLDSVPNWSGDWPVEQPAVPDPFVAALPRL